jgi:hypothetical protein
MICSTIWLDLINNNLIYKIVSSIYSVVKKTKTMILIFQKPISS